MAVTKSLELGMVKRLKEHGEDSLAAPPHGREVGREVAITEEVKQMGGLALEQVSHSCKK